MEQLTYQFKLIRNLGGKVFKRNKWSIKRLNKRKRQWRPRNSKNKYIKNGWIKKILVRN